MWLLYGFVSGSQAVDAGGAGFHGEATRVVGGTVAAGEDLDGDGYDDIVIGAGGDEEMDLAFFYGR